MRYSISSWTSLPRRYILGVDISFSYVYQVIELIQKGHNDSFTRLIKVLNIKIFASINFFSFIFDSYIVLFLTEFTTNALLIDGVISREEYIRDKKAPFFIRSILLRSQKLDTNFRCYASSFILFN